MIYQFSDNKKTVTHLGFVISASVVSPTILRLRLSYIQNVVFDDFLNYQSAKKLLSDYKRFNAALAKHAKHSDNVVDENKIGFLADAESNVEVDPSEEDEE